MSIGVNDNNNNLRVFAAVLKALNEDRLRSYASLINKTHDRGQYRLISPDNLRICWSTYIACSFAKFNDMVKWIALSEPQLD